MSGIPADAVASISTAASHFGAKPTNVGQVFATPARVFGFRAADRACVSVAVVHTGTFCASTLPDAGGEAAPEIMIVDGKMFAVGLVANDVANVDVSLAATSKTPGTSSPIAASVANNTFIAALPYGGGGVGAVTVNVSRSDGAVSTAVVPASAPPHA